MESLSDWMKTWSACTKQNRKTALTEIIQNRNEIQKMNMFVLKKINSSPVHINRAPGCAQETVKGL